MFLAIINAKRWSSYFLTLVWKSNFYDKMLNVETCQPSIDLAKLDLKRLDLEKPQFQENWWKPYDDEETGHSNIFSNHNLKFHALEKDVWWKQKHGGFQKNHATSWKRNNDCCLGVWAVQKPDMKAFCLISCPGKWNHSEPLCYLE